MGIQIHDIVGNMKRGKNITVETHGYASVVKIYANCVVSVDLHIYGGRTYGDICLVGKSEMFFNSLVIEA